MKATPRQTTILPSRMTLTLTDVRWTRFGRKLMGLPVTTRASRGFRRHVRKIKAGE